MNSLTIRRLATFLSLGFILQITGCGHGNPGGEAGKRKIESTVPGKIGIAAYPATLGQAGRVIARENGLFNFNPVNYCYGLNTCPKQLQAMVEKNAKRPLEQQIHFVKISLRTLGDGSWVVAHDRVQYIVAPLRRANQTKKLGNEVQILEKLPVDKQLLSFYRNGMLEYEVANSVLFENLDADALKKFNKLSSLPSQYRVIKVDLSQLDSVQYKILKRHYGDRFSVYRFADYTANGLAHYFNYMLNLKTSPNQRIINEIDRLNLNQRVVLESSHNSDVEWIYNHQGRKSGIFFMGRVGTPAELDTLLQRAPAYGKKMWAIEVNPNTPHTAALVKKIKATQYISHVDSMPYDPLKEASATACQKPLLEVGSDITMSSRPMDCLSKMRSSQL